MNDWTSKDVTPGTDVGNTLGERVICVVARDVLSVDRHDTGFGGLLLAAWRGRWLVLAFVLIFTLAAVAYSFAATDWYVADTVLTPVDQTNMNGLASQLGNLSMLTSLAGINLDKHDDTAESLGVLKSRDFARQFIEDQGLLHVLLWNDWNAQTGQWKESDPRRQPDIRNAIRYFDRSVLLVNEDRKTGLVTLGIRWKDPVVAASWANMLVDRLNAQMRARALTLGEAHVKYLGEELNAATQVTVQTAIAQLISTELQKLMVARTNKEFAFRIVDHAEVPKFRAWPKRTIIVALGILAGGLAGLLAAFIYDSFRREFPSAPRKA